MPATKVAANVYQLYIVLYQWASMLISHSQGIDDITVRAKKKMYTAAQTVLFQMYFFLPARSNGLSSMLRESFLIFHPRNDQPTRVMIVHTVKNPLFRNGD